jgi:hypothetical protein
MVPIMAALANVPKPTAKQIEVLTQEIPDRPSTSEGML